MRWILLVVFVGACDASEAPAVAVAPPPRVAMIPTFVPRQVAAIAEEPEADGDGDGIPDIADRCPDDPEDIDGFEDEDGCPDVDNDSEGIVDSIDRCPGEPEDGSGYEDIDGCPDVVRDVVE